MMNDDSYPVMYFTSIPPLLNNHGRIGKPQFVRSARQPAHRPDLRLKQNVLS